MTEFFADFGLRDGLLVLGPVFIAAILLHGYLRMRNGRNNLRMALDKSFDGSDLSDPEDLAMLRAELPNGGARVRTAPEQVNLDFDDVPVLMDPLDEQEAFDQETAQEAAQEPIRATQPDTSDEATERPEKYVVLNIQATGDSFRGQAILEALVEQNMRFGEMDIFHRQDANNQPQFSLMNAVQPGSFDLNTIDAVETPALSMFMRAHEVQSPTAVYNEMVAVARYIGKELGGELLDESRSAMTEQTIEHCRQELIEYERKHS